MVEPVQPVHEELVASEDGRKSAGQPCDHVTGVVVNEDHARGHQERALTLESFLRWLGDSMRIKSFN